MTSNPNPKSNTKRKRGMSLSPSGLRRSNQAIQSVETSENAGKRFTVEELSKRTGISTSTLSRLWASKSGVDRRILNLLFNTFKLDLLDSDLQIDFDEVAVKGIQAWASTSPAIVQISYPSGSIPVDSLCYVSRSEVDDLALHEIVQPSCILRIKAPSGFGKSSLILRLLQHCNQLGYATVSINLQQADTETLADPHAFFRWFRAVLALKLKLDSNQDQYWDELLGSKLSTTLYLRESVLPQLHRPLVLIMNEVEQVFEYADTAKNFLPLLRSWHEEAQHDEVWKQLRLVVSYSTDAYLPLDINQSPLNVGLPLTLPEFNREQIEKLAELYSVRWSEQECDRLLALIGGNPALVSLALYHLHQGTTFDDLLQSACTLKGIYRNHLQRLFAQVNGNEQWMERLAPLVQGADAIHLDPIFAYKLEGMGLIQPASGGWRLSCELYRAAFETYLLNSAPP